MNSSAQRALITGGASGIGRAIAGRFARAGMRVAILDVDASGAERAADELRQGGADAIASGVDVADETAARAAVERAERTWGGIDVLVNNAGLPSAWTGGDELARWRLGIDQTLSSVFLMCALVAPGMRDRRRGAIVNISSRAAFLPMPTAEWYGAAKAGVVSLTRSLATRLGPHGIRVNAICPDVIETPRTRAMLADEARRRALLARIPLGRFGRPEDVAEAALFLASDETAGFVTGIALGVDGGAG
jgi:NAD(P)-dependent dehydrogenase (short-subunit alcohol dehydrogenase family)